MDRKKYITLSLLLLPSFFCLEAQAKRIVSLMPSYTEIIFELGAGSDLVGVSNFCDHPSAATNIEKTGDYLRPNVEKIYSLKPDIVFAGAWLGTPVVQNLRSAGVKVVELPEETRVSDIFRTTRLIGAELGRDKAAEKMVGKMQKKLGALDNTGAGRLSVYIEAGEGMWTAGNRSFISDAVEYAGARNIFALEDKKYFQTSWETVVARDPDIILVLAGAIASVAQRPLAGQMRAFESKTVFSPRDRAALMRPGPRLIDEIKALKKQFNAVKKR